MTVAHGDDCGDFPQPTEPVQFCAVLRQVRDHRDEGGHGGYYYDDGQPDDTTTDADSGTGDNSAGGDGHQGYDPRLYEAPPQGAPDTAPPPEADPGAEQLGQ